MPLNWLMWIRSYTVRVYAGEVRGGCAHWVQSGLVWCGRRRTVGKHVAHGGPRRAPHGSDDDARAEDGFAVRRIGWRTSNQSGTYAVRDVAGESGDSPRLVLQVDSEAVDEHPADSDAAPGATAHCHSVPLPGDEGSSRRVRLS